MYLILSGFLSPVLKKWLEKSFFPISLWFIPDLPIFLYLSLCVSLWIICLLHGLSTHTLTFLEFIPHTRLRIVYLTHQCHAITQLKNLQWLQILTGLTPNSLFWWLKKKKKSLENPVLLCWAWLLLYDSVVLWTWGNHWSPGKRSLSSKMKY